MISVDVDIRRHPGSRSVDYDESTATATMAVFLHVCDTHSSQCGNIAQNIANVILKRDHQIGGPGMRD